MGHLQIVISSIGIPKTDLTLIEHPVFRLFLLPGLLKFELAVPKFDVFRLNAVFLCDEGLGFLNVYAVDCDEFSRISLLFLMIQFLVIKAM